MKTETPEKTIERLSVIRRIITQLIQQRRRHVYSHELAEMTASTAAQIRRDLMLVGFTGSPKKGYELEGLLSHIAEFLDAPKGDSVILIGLGNLGRALLPFFAAHHPKLRIEAAIDPDPQKTGRVIHGCPCYPPTQLEAIITRNNTRVAIIAVPVDAAQQTTDRLVEAGICGLLNFAPVVLNTPPHVAVENIDMSVALEKVAFLARNKIDIKQARQEEVA